MHNALMAKKKKEQGAPETAFLQKLSNLLLEFMIISLVTYVSEEDQNFEEFRRKTLVLMAENEADAAKLPWVARLVERPKRQ